MKTEVKVNGVTLTRQQIEDALKELNSPAFIGGELVEFDDGPNKSIKGIVIVNGVIAEYCNSKYGKVLTGHVRIFDGTSTFTRHENQVRKI